jgi:hypothetical protein
MADTSQDRAHPSGWTVDTLKEYFRSELQALTDKMNERDRFYLGQIAEQKNLNANSFASSEKAIEKAETAQKEYNARSNEFRGQLDDQAKTLMARTEVLAMLKAANDKSDVSNNALDRRIDKVDAEIVALREFRSEGGGKDKAQRDNLQQRNWSIGILVAALFGIMSFVLSVLAYMKK